MRIHYISCHSVLEYDEVKLFTEMGHDVFSNGAYVDPRGHITLPRPGIEGMKFHEDYAELSRSTPKTNLPDGLIKNFDVIIVMHSPEVLFQNWIKLREKKVIFRSIGQSTPGIEKRLQQLVNEGLIVVRYSPKERNIPNFAGETAMIRFYKDPNEFNNWNGRIERVINFTQSLMGRRDFCHYDEIMQSTEGFNRVIYGTGNEDLGALNGGELPFEMQKQAMRDNRVYIYGGTWPASYTLSLIEAMMTGIPVVAIGKDLAQTERFELFDFYEVHEIIHDSVSGFVSDDMTKMRESIDKLFKDNALARKISEASRTRAIDLFGKTTIRNQWEELFNRL